MEHLIQDIQEALGDLVVEEKVEILVVVMEFLVQLIQVVVVEVQPLTEVELLVEVVEKV